MDTTINQALGSLCISGIDAKKFLQGQLTCNVEEVTEDTFRLAAHCNPQGRMISFFRLFLIEGNYHLLMPQDLLDIATQALKKYAVFFKVVLSITTPPEKISLKNFSQSADIQAGIPRIYAASSGKFLPHELNLQLIDAISFNKGCYTGQEIIARMHYRGQLKKHMYRASLSLHDVPAPGSDLVLDSQVAGEVVDAIATHNGIELLFVSNKNGVEKMNIKLLPLPYSLS